MYGHFAWNYRQLLNFQTSEIQSLNFHSLETQYGGARHAWMRSPEIREVSLPLLRAMRMALKGQFLKKYGNSSDRQCAGDFQYLMSRHSECYGSIVQRLTRQHESVDRSLLRRL